MASENYALLDVRGLKKHYPVEKGFFRRAVGMVKAVDGVDILVKKGETLGLVGESGCGKTTLGRCILRAIEPTSGEVYLRVNDELVDVTRLRREELHRIRPHAQMIFQDPYSSLDPRMTVMNIIAEPLVANKLAGGSELTDRVVELMKLVGLEATHLKRYPHAFSGGQRQRIGIARALAPRPELVIADEAVSALDVSVRAQILNLLQDLQDSLRLTYLFVAHDLSVVEHISDRVAVMYVGKIVELGETEALYIQPLHPYTEALLSAVPTPNPDTKMERIILPGEVANPANPPSGCYFHPRCRYARDICSHEEPQWEEIDPGHWVACHRARELKLKGVSKKMQSEGGTRTGNTPPSPATTTTQKSVQPIFFERNRVARVYRGGALFHGFFGDDAVDNFLPEEWVASTVRALNRDSNDPLEGLSLIAGARIPFLEHLRQHPEALGERSELGILVKVLDSAVRLPVQAHPDKAFARRHFDSAHGKAEMWIVLATRDDAKVFLGFRRALRREEFAAAIAASEENRDALPALLNEVPVKTGDVYFIPPRVVHAIGAGCLILEIQEPTDFTLQPEAWCGDYRLSEYEQYLGLSHETALECFDFDDLVGERAIRRARIEPASVTDDEGRVVVESLVGREAGAEFVVNRFLIRGGTLAVSPGPAIHVVTTGTGEIESEGRTWALRAGSYYFLPANLHDVHIRTTSSIEIVESRPGRI